MDRVWESQDRRVAEGKKCCPKPEPKGSGDRGIDDPVACGPLSMRDPRREPRRMRLRLAMDRAGAIAGRERSGGSQDA